MDDEKLIELVRNYPVLYDLYNPKYMDTSLKRNIWNQIGTEMKAVGLSCKTRWNNIRDNYRKSQKRTVTKSGGSSKKTKLYKYSEQLSFLNKYFGETETKGNIDSQNDENEDEDTQQHDDQEGCRQDDTGEPTVDDLNDELQSYLAPPLKRKNTFDVPQKSKTRKSASKLVEPQQTASAKLMKYRIRKNENQTSTTSSPHPVDAFLCGIAPTLKTFTPYYLNLVKSEIFASVQNYEMKMLMEQRSNEVSYSNILHNVTPNYSSSSSPASTRVLSPVPQSQEHATTTTTLDEQ